jgi:uncharacterized peroxidase-related enzyme
MAWIEIRGPHGARGSLEQLYDQVKSPAGHVDNILQIHSLRPRTLQAHLYLYKAALHSKPNALSPRERELVGVCVSILNDCDYCVLHHTAGLARHIQDESLARRLARASVGKETHDLLTHRERAFCEYAWTSTKLWHTLLTSTGLPMALGLK